MDLRRQFLTYLVIGLLNTAVGFSTTLLAINILNASYFHATVLGYSVGAVFSFFMNKRFTFRYAGAISGGLVRFLIVCVVAYSLAYYSGLAIGRVLKDSYEAAGHSLAGKAFKNVAAVAGGVVYTVVGFAGNKLFTFRRT